MSQSTARAITDPTTDHLHPRDIAVTQELRLALDDDRDIEVIVEDVQANAQPERTELTPDGDELHYPGHIRVRATVATTRGDLGTCRNGREYDHARIRYTRKTNGDDPDSEELVLEGAATIHGDRDYQHIAGIAEIETLGHAHISRGDA
ncbi:hypothetical protein U3A55_12055 [Salarchaeum sp. III]|uniref:hypothetical protein n=1 Tax=Salarchaeum sp. III TaxID=3107927 RepID=UPI002ED77E43